MKVVIPLDPNSGAVLAYTTSVEATGPFVILQALLSAHRYPCERIDRVYNSPKFVTIQLPSALNLFRL